ncbi:hypothetical protein [Nocardia asteroides]|uniref:Uncharacterized protein n=1 Tax=Nocardia asteroides NBRC 15531 TaxID=1110697 RepID=U5E8B4_NOCAS|nr:hypothetical protein [Nocardia asteroides]TLF67140.1 hypothetical protein FEK33_14210 [Nocardia asteroides NBRC 15531]UGT51582.1 hypothetical protein LT345_13975 [Nocardia asteroides]SFM22552.1 hypothetical protein SAMN05444423_102304 [Nocardia asteroides]VEG35522.1 Uncharacterised protein [Nocardia asteroides]GAD86317.1 hypothetical protein NCAST_32_08040 [Nocardia asteroides NBRC 15531]
MIPLEDESIAAPSSRIDRGEIPTRRITVYFDGPTPQDALALEYAATSAEAWEFTTAAVHAGLLVTVDGGVHPALRRLPCRSLWH